MCFPMKYPANKPANEEIIYKMQTTNASTPKTRRAYPGMICKLKMRKYRLFYRLFRRESGS